jgi:hypothetical protein
MGNSCRAFVKAPIERVIALVGDMPAIKRFGEGGIIPANNSYFGNVKPQLLSFIEVNYINSNKEVCTKLKELSEDVYFQDLDAYGNIVFKFQTKPQ